MFSYINTTLNIEIHSVSMDDDMTKQVFNLLFASNPEFLGINYLEIFDDQGNLINKVALINDEVTILN